MSACGAGTSQYKHGSFGHRMLTADAGNADADETKAGVSSAVASGRETESSSSDQRPLCRITANTGGASSTDLAEAKMRRMT